MLMMEIYWGICLPKIIKKGLWFDKVIAKK